MDLQTACTCGCGRELPQHDGKGRRRQFYSDACRQRAHRSTTSQKPVQEEDTSVNRDMSVLNRDILPILAHGEMRAILKYPGSKWRLASWIVSHFPAHKHYVEPYCGSAACFFAKVPAEHEVLNDLNTSIVNLFRVLRTRGDELAQVIALSPWSEQEYNEIEGHIVCDDDLEHARRFLVRSWQAHGGTIAQVSGWKHNGIDGNVFPTRLWKKLPERLLAVVDRLKDAEIRNKPALEVIRYYHAPDVLLYVDPPYVLSTRSRKYYAHEMTDTDHRDLLEALDLHPGPVILSGYAHPLYDNRLTHWQQVSVPSVGEHGKHQVEVLWLNAKVPVVVQQSLFGEGEVSA
jgi:DNA adenine methylase